MWLSSTPAAWMEAISMLGPSRQCHEATACQVSKQLLAPRQLQVASGLQAEVYPGEGKSLHNLNQTQLHIHI